MSTITIIGTNDFSGINFGNKAVVNIQVRNKGQVVLLLPLDCIVAPFENVILCELDAIINIAAALRELPFLCEQKFTRNEECVGNFKSVGFGVERGFQSMEQGLNFGILQFQEKVDTPFSRFSGERYIFLSPISIKGFIEGEGFLLNGKLDFHISVLGNSEQNKSAGDFRVR